MGRMLIGLFIIWWKMKTKCYSVRLQSLRNISAKACKVTDFTGAEEIIPSSQIFGQDYDVMKSDAYWIAAWILEKKNIQYSRKKEAWFDADSRKMMPTYTVTHHVPERKEPIDNNTIKKLKR